jgi:hypothetical protein
MQQNDVIFATLFVYGADRQARWFVASDMRPTSSRNDGAQFRGALYQVDGPPLFAPFSAEQAIRREVGTMTFDYARPDRGTLTYSVDGATVTKGVMRQTWTANDVGGRYLMTRVEQGMGGACSLPPGTLNLGETQVLLSGGNVTMTTGLNNSGAACTYSGAYSQDGHMGSIAGSYSCANGSGPFTMSEVAVSPNGFLARISETVNGCNVVGNIGGPRLDVP